MYPYCDLFYCLELARSDLLLRGALDDPFPPFPFPPFPGLLLDLVLGLLLDFTLGLLLDLDPLPPFPPLPDLGVLEDGLLLEYPLPPLPDRFLSWLICDDLRLAETGDAKNARAERQMHSKIATRLLKTVVDAIVFESFFCQLYLGTKRSDCVFFVL